MPFSRSLTLAVPVAVFACALLAGGCDRETGEVAQPKAERSAKLDRSHKGTPLPDLTVSDDAGGTLDLESLKGRPALINLWATWCAPCVTELPTLDRVAEREGAQLRVITISQDMEQPEKVRPFLEQRGLSHLSPWLDPKGDLPFELGTASLPTTILYDAQGREVWRYVGDNDWTSEAAAALLQETGGTGEKRP